MMRIFCEYKVNPRADKRNNEKHRVQLCGQWKLLQNDQQESKAPKEVIDKGSSYGRQKL